MTNVLVVDDDKEFLETLVESLSQYKSEFTVLPAGNGEEATRIAASAHIDLLVTDLDMPVMDGYELLVFMLHHFPAVEIVVMGDTESGRVGRALTEGGAFFYLQKPVRIQEVVDLVRSIAARTAAGRLRGLSLPGFLQLLNSERKSCSLTVKSQGRTGSLSLREGEIVAAVCNGMDGEEAAYEILSWPSPEIEIDEFVSPADSLMKIPMTRLLMEAARQKDETERS